MIFVGGQLKRKPNIIANIDSLYVGLWLSIIEILSKDYNIIITTRSYNKRFIESHFTNSFLNIENRDEREKKIMREELCQVDHIKKALEYENKYNETFSMLMSQDRGLGKGYIFNADRHPYQAKEFWSYENKIKKILNEFMFWEYIVEKYSPVLCMTLLVPHKIFSLVSRKKGITFVSLRGCRYGNRWLWAEDEYGRSAKYIENVQKHAAMVSDNSENPIDYVRDNIAKHLNRGDYKFTSAIKKLFMRFPGDFYRFLTGYYRKNDGYRFLAWYPAILRRPYIYKYFQKYGKKPDELRSFKLIFFPLHLEPEMALLLRSPEQNNSMELISWISKSLPADTILVIKEQPHAYGIRSRRYYENYRKIPNVALASPEISSWEWIKQSSIVATITGTTGIEAVYFEKPILSFGKHEIINYLPSVRYANNFESVRKAIEELIALPPDDLSFKKSKTALYNAQIESSFEMPGLEKLINSRDIHMDFAKQVVASLKNEYGF